MNDPQALQKQSLILQKISHIIARTKDVATIANAILDCALEYTDAEKGSVMLVNELNELSILAARGLDVPFSKSYKVKIGEEIAGVVAKMRSPVLVLDIETDPRFKRLTRKRYHTKSFISSPIISGERLFGVININDKKNGAPFAEEELNLLNVIADQAAIVFENAFLIRQLRTKAADLEQINRKLIAADIDKTQFITRVSHELRTPLNAIKGAVYYLLQSDKLKREKEMEFYNIILNETHSLVSIVENLIDFLRLEDEALVIKKSFFSIPELIAELSQSPVLKIMLKQKNIRLDVRSEKPVPDIVGDKIRVTHMFMNLVEGLSFYLRDGDAITVAFGGDDPIHIAVSASRSIPDEVISNMGRSQDAFFREWSMDETRLHLARKAAEAHGWTFEARNSEGSFCVDISIPRREQDAMDAAVSMAMNLLADFVSELMGISICSIMLRDELTADLVIRGAKGLSDEVVKKTRINVGDQIAGWVAASGKPLLIEDIERDLHMNKKNISQYNTKSLLSLPLRTHDKVIGVLNLNNKKSAEVFTARDLSVAQIISARIAHFVEALSSGTYGEPEVQRRVTALHSLLDAMKKYHKKETPMADLVCRLIEKLGVNEEEKQKAIYVSMIYDLGLMQVDETIMMKTDLTDAERREIQHHVYATIELLHTIEFAEDIKKIILHHHERYDGTGYPSGLKGVEIPLVSRVLAVADSYLAMITRKSYGQQYSHEEALRNLQERSGSWYDPEIVKAFQENMAADPR